MGRPRPRRDSKGAREVSDRLQRWVRLAILHSRFLLSRLQRRPFLLRVDLLEGDAELAITSARELRRATGFSLESVFARRIQQHLQPNDTVFDVGANIGVITLALATTPNGRTCTFHCFEPEPRNHRQLQRNLTRNGLDGRAFSHALALGDRDGQVELFVRGGPGEGRHSIASPGRATDAIHVPIATVASFGATHGAVPDVLKVDVEGAEGYVLAGMEALGSRRLPREIFLEIHPRGLGDRMPDGRTIDAWLNSRGYRREWRQQRRSGVHCHYTRSLVGEG